MRLGDRTLPAAIELLENLEQLIPAMLAIAQIKGATRNNNIRALKTAQRSPLNLVLSTKSICQERGREPPETS